MPHFKYGNTEGYQSWDSPTYCWEGCGKDPKSHLHCADLDGKPVYYEKPLKSTLEFDRGDAPERGHGIIAAHWHYEGCMIDLNDPEVDGRPRVKLCPQTGDRIWVLDEMPAELRDDEFMGAL